MLTPVAASEAASGTASEAASEAAPRPWIPILRGLLVFRVVELSWMILVRASLLLLPSLLRESSSRFFEIQERVSAAGWTLFALVGVALTYLLARSLADSLGKHLAWWTCGLGAIDATFSLAFTFETFTELNLFGVLDSFHLRAPFTLLILGIGLAFDLLFWTVLTKIGKGIPGKTWTVSYFAVRMVGALISLTSLLPYDMYRSLILESKWLLSSLMWTRFATATVHGLMVILALSAVSKSVAGASNGAGTQPAPVPASAQYDMIVGAAWLIGGLLITIASYATASGGGRYLVTTGAIGYGIVRLVRGFMRLGKS